MAKLEKRVTLRNLFEGEMLGGFPPEQWEIFGMKAKLVARYRFIQQRAAILANMPYSPENNMPANIHAEARRLELLASDALKAISKDDPYWLAWLSVDLGKCMEKFYTVLAVAKAIDVTSQLLGRCSAGGKAAAEGSKELAQENITKAAEIWAELENSGKPPHNRAAIISQRMGYPVDTVRGWIRKAGLR